MMDKQNIDQSESGFVDNNVSADHPDAHAQGDPAMSTEDTLAKMCEHHDQAAKQRDDARAEAAALRANFDGECQLTKAALAAQRVEALVEEVREDVAKLASVWGID